MREKQDRNERDVGNCLTRSKRGTAFARKRMPNHRRRSPQRGWGAALIQVNPTRSGSEMMNQENRKAGKIANRSRRRFVRLPLRFHLDVAEPACGRIGLVPAVCSQKESKLIRPDPGGMGGPVVGLSEVNFSVCKRVSLARFRGAARQRQSELIRVGPGCFPGVEKSCGGKWGQGVASGALALPKGRSARLSTSSAFTLGVRLNPT